MCIVQPSPWVKIVQPKWCDKCNFYKCDALSSLQSLVRLAPPMSMVRLVQPMFSGGTQLFTPSSSARLARPIPVVFRHLCHGLVLLFVTVSSEIDILVTREMIIRGEYSSGLSARLNS